MMKKLISLILVLVFICAFIPSALAFTTEADAQDIHVTMYGLDQPYVNRIWATTDKGYVEYIQVWDTADKHSALKSTAFMQPNHEYMIKLRVTGMVGDVYINGKLSTSAISWGDFWTKDCHAEGRFTFTTPNYDWKNFPEPAIYVTAYGINQTNINNIWAITSFGQIDKIVIQDGDTILDKKTFLQYDHDYTIRITIKDTAGDIYINGIKCTASQYWDTAGERHVQGIYHFSIPSPKPIMWNYWYMPMYFNYYFW